MTTRVRRAILLVACAAACSGTDEGREQPNGSAVPAVSSATPAATAERANDRRIVFIGTSLTAGLGLPEEQAYPALIQERIDAAGLNYTVVNRGVSGETSAGARERIGWLLRDPAEVYVIETGANDGLRGLGVEAMRANIQAIIDTIKSAAPAAQIFLVSMESPPNLGPAYTAAFRRVFAELAVQNDVELIPFLLNGVVGDPAYNQADGMHPNAAGARIVAENVWRGMEGELRATRDAGRATRE
jgi:acyl-CoA thioesterase-1